MARNQQFGELINSYRNQSGRAASRALGQNEMEMIKAVLRRIYRRLHADFNWPHLYITRDKTLQAGERIYSFPAEFDFDRIVTAQVRENGEDQWYPLNYGITYQHLNVYDSDGDERADFPSTWDVYESDQFEIWPIPETSGHTVRFRGYSRAKSLVNESDIVDLDEDLIVLYALAEDAAKRKDGDAQIRLQEARQHYMRLRGNTQKGEPVDMKVSNDREQGHKGIRIDFAERRE